MAKGKTDKIVVDMHEPQPKKHVVRYDSIDPKDAMLSAYMSKEALDKIGNPEKIRVTVESAD